MNKISGLLLFAAGAAIGSLVTWKLVAEKYEKITQEEIDSVKKAFASRKSAVVKRAEKRNIAKKATNKPDISEYSSIVKGSGYKNYSKISESEPEEEDMGTEEKEDIHDEPYIIRPDQFGEDFDYEQITLTYYTDGILADDQDKIIEDFESIVGTEAIDILEKGEEDSVYVRNDDRMCEYEICYDMRKYSEVAGTGNE